MRPGIRPETLFKHEQMIRYRALLHVAKLSPRTVGRMRHKGNPFAAWCGQRWAIRSKNSREDSRSRLGEGGWNV